MESDDHEVSSCAASTKTDLLCFRHSCSHRYQVCLEAPSRCFLCGSELASSGLSVPPFLITGRHLHSSSSRPDTFHLVLSQVSGSSDSIGPDDLWHVGLRLPTGEILSYDCDGLARDARWPNCFSCSLGGGASYDAEITQCIVNSDQWTSERYNDSTHNCLDFVIHALEKYGIELDEDSLLDKLTKLVCRVISYNRVLHGVQSDGWCLLPDPQADQLHALDP